MSGVQPGGQAGAGARLRALERQEVVIAPDVLRPALDAPARVLDVLDVVLVGDLERAEAAVADVAGLEAVVRAALLTRQLGGSHDQKTSAGVRSWRRSWKASATSLRNWHLSRMREVAGASKGQSLHPSGCVQLCERHLSKASPRAQGAGRLPFRANFDADDHDDRRAAKSRCRTCPSHASGVRRGHAAGSSTRPSEPERPNVEIVEFASATASRCAGSTSSARGRPTARGWRSTSTSTRSTTRTSTAATSARRSTSTTTTCSSSCTSRPTTRRSGA